MNEFENSYSLTAKTYILKKTAQFLLCSYFSRVKVGKGKTIERKPKNTKGCPMSSPLFVS